MDTATRRGACSAKRVNSNPSLDATERGTENLAGIGRQFASIYAVVDPHEAFRLIELTCYKEEIDTFKMAALAFVAESDPQQFIELTKDLKAETVTGYFDLIVNSLALDDLAAVERIAELLPNGDVKAKFMATVVERFADSPKMRTHLPFWLNRTLDAIPRQSSKSFVESPAVTVASLTRTAKSISPSLSGSRGFQCALVLRAQRFRRRESRIVFDRAVDFRRSAVYRADVDCSAV